MALPFRSLKLVAPFVTTLLLPFSFLASVDAAPTSYTLSSRADVGFLDDVLLFDAPGVQADGQDVVEMEAYVFARQIDLGPITDALGSALDGLGLGGITDTAGNIGDRLKLFATSGKEGKTVKVNIDGCGEVTLGATSGDDKGLSVTNVTCSQEISGATLNAKGALDTRDITSTVFPSAPDGFGVISDIDDTVKVSNVLDKVKLAKATLIDEPETVTGMPELYKSLAQSLDSPSFSYVSGSPYQLYPFLQPFINSNYPGGPLFLRNLTITDIGNVLSTLTDEDSTLKFKGASIDRIHGLYPAKKFLMIGDSTEKDPETYAEAFRKYGDATVACIWIRSVDGADNSDERFAAAFNGVPAEKTRVFNDADIAGLKDIDVKGGSC